MSGRGAFYSFSFDLGPDLDLVTFANKLLKKNMASVAGSPSRDGLRVSNRLVETDRHHRESEKFGQWLDVMYSYEYDWNRLFRLNWKLTLRILWMARKIVVPAYGRALLHRIFWGQGPRRSPHHPSETNRQIPEGMPEGIRESREMVGTAVQGMADILWDQHALGAMRLRLEQQMYFPRYYLRAEPFIRLEMNRAYFTDSSHKTEPIHISLMIHRSGICILTLATPIAKEFGVDDGYGYLQSRTRALDEVEVSVPIVRWFGAAAKSITVHNRPVDGVRDGLKWVVMNSWAGDESLQLSMRSVFNLYVYALQKVARRRISAEWKCHTTLFQGTPRCGCDGAEAKERHEAEFAQLMLRTRSRMPVTDEARDSLLKNFLMNSDEELWLAPGNAIHTSWDRDNIDYIGDTETVVPIESAILQHRQLEAIDYRTVNVSIRDRDLFAAQRQLATGLPEYGRNLMTDINAPDVVDGLASKLKTPQLYSRLNDRVKVLESVVNTRYNRKQSRRSISISFIGLVIVVLLLLPRIKEFIDKLAQLTPTHSFVDWLNDHFGSSDRTVVAIYLVAIALAALVFIVMAARFPLSRWRWRKRQFGFPTKVDIEVKRAARTLPGGVEGSTSDDAPPDPFPEH